MFTFLEMLAMVVYESSSNLHLHLTEILSRTSFSRKVVSFSPTWFPPVAPASSNFSQISLQPFSAAQRREVFPYWSHTEKENRENATIVKRNVNVSIWLERWEKKSKSTKLFKRHREDRNWITVSSRKMSVHQGEVFFSSFLGNLRTQNRFGTTTFSN